MKIWFMFDNHTFDGIEARDRTGLIASARQLFHEDGCGSLFVRDDMGGMLEKLTLNGHQLHQISKYDRTYGVNYDEVEAWADAVLVEIEFQKLMAC